MIARAESKRFPFATGDATRTSAPQSVSPPPIVPAITTDSSPAMLRSSGQMSAASSSAARAPESSMRTLN